jgi:hypothetical protein
MTMEVHVLDADTGKIVTVFMPDGTILGDPTVVSKAIHMLAMSTSRYPNFSLTSAKPLDCQGIPNNGKGKTDGN